jgi:type VI protein secretion system component VasK
VSDWSVVFLGVIAVAVTVMACAQVGVIVFGARLAKRVDQLASQIDREIKPLLTNLNKVGEEAARAAQLAATQVERVDRLFADVALRVEDTAASLQSAILTPAREGFALLSGVRAAFAALRDMRSASAPARAARHDDEEALFIG